MLSALRNTGRSRRRRRSVKYYICLCMSSMADFLMYNTHSLLRMKGRWIRLPYLLQLQSGSRQKLWGPSISCNSHCFGHRQQTQRLYILKELARSALLTATVAVIQICVKFQSTQKKGKRLPFLLCLGFIKLRIGTKTTSRETKRC